MKKLLLTTAIIIGLSTSAMAEQRPEPGALDSRIRTVVYSEHDVVDLDVHYGYQSVVQFSPEESITNISYGDSSAWEDGVNQERNTLFLRSILPNAHTNLIVMTNLRTYNFEISSHKASSAHAPDMTFNLRFRYPGSFAQSFENSISIATQKDPSSPANYNFDYEFAGYKGQVPRRAFDDGKFTYFEFGDDVELPAIFLVEDDGTESIIEHRTEGRYVIVHRLGKQFTLRQGDDVTCIFNTAYTPNPELDAGSPQEQGSEPVTLLKEWGA